jgi:hypothetical protein
MTQESLAEQIKGMAESYRCLFESLEHPAHQNKFGNIDDYVAATRYKTDSLDMSRAEYYSHAFIKLQEQDGRIKTFPPMKFTSTLEKNTSFVDIGSGPLLLIDLYQGEILEELGRLYIADAPPEDGAALGLRLLAEHYLAAHQEPVATYVAICRSVIVKGLSARGGASRADPHEIEWCGNMQEVFILTHEAGHLLWFRKQQPDWFAPMAIEWIVKDHVMLSKLIQQSENAARRVNPFAGGAPVKSAYSPEQLKATLDRRCDAQGGFMEELYADFYAWTSCMRLFFGHRPAAQVYRALSLALRNIALLDAVRRLAERATDVETLDDASSRRQILRLGLRRLFGDLRADDKWRNNLRTVTPRVTEADFNVDFAQIGVDVEERYKQKIWDPFFVAALPMVMTLPSRDRLAKMHQWCNKEYGETPALKILRECPVDAKVSARIIAATE